MADGQLELFVVEASAGAGPVLRSELEVSAPGPVRQDADHIGEVGLDVELVQGIPSANDVVARAPTSWLATTSARPEAPGYPRRR